jgi:hypothetical protein
MTTRLASFRPLETRASRTAAPPSAHSPCDIPSTIWTRVYTCSSPIFPSVVVARPENERARERKSERVRERERERERDRANEPLTKRTHSQTLQILLFRRGALPEMVQRKRAFLRRERVSRAELRRGHDDDDDDACGRENHHDDDDDDFSVPRWWCGKGVY